MKLEAAFKLIQRDKIENCKAKKKKGIKIDT